MGDATVQSSGLPRVLMALGTAAAAVLVIAHLLHTPRFDPATAAPDPLKGVQIGLYSAPGGPIRAGATLRPDEQIVVTFMNPRPEAVHLCFIAVDAIGGVHWLVPLERDGTSKGLPPIAEERVVLPATSLGDLPPGPLDFIALVNTGVIALERIDAFTPEERTPAGLRERFPDSVVLEWPVDVASPAAP